MPSFRRATSIELHARDLRLCVRERSFRSLESLSLSGCHVDLATFIPTLRRLRRLSFNATNLLGMDNIAIHSLSLEELVFEHKNIWETGLLTRFSIDAPALKHLTASFQARADVGVSILAPMVKKVSWRCFYTGVIYGVALWGLSEVGLDTQGQISSRREDDGDACLQLPSVHVLSLHMCAKVCFLSCLLNLPDRLY
jgi:hypothetical protein